jgi:hypothetical protein
LPSRRKVQQLELHFNARLPIAAKQRLSTRNSDRVRVGTLSSARLCIMAF